MELFKRVLKQCIDKGMVSGRRQAVDSVYIKANASLDSMVEPEILSDAEVFGAELSREEEYTKEVKLERPRDYNELKPKKNPSNKTHYSTSDPDARMSVKPGKAAAMNYLGQVGVDMASHVITHVEVFRADKRDQQCLPELLPKLVETLKGNGLQMQEVVADAGYSSLPALKAIEDQGLTGYIPNNRRFIYKREGFSYQADENIYLCPTGGSLTYRGTHPSPTGHKHVYKLSKLVCGECSRKNECPVMTVNGGIINEVVGKHYYDRMHERMQTRKAKVLMKKRQSTVEPVIGTLVTYLGMKKVGCKGLAGVNKCLAIAAVAYNLKKMLKYGSRKILNQTQVLERNLKKAGSLYSLLFKGYNPYSELI